MPVQSPVAHAAGLLALLSAFLAVCPARAGVVLNQRDTFTTNTNNWREPSKSPNPPFWISSGGPLGGNDGYIENDSTGESGAGSRQVMLNNSQWTGNYVAAGVTRITADFMNVFGTPLFMRVTLRSLATTYSSIDAFEVPIDGQWHHAVFDFNEAHMGPTPATGSDSLATVMSGVIEMRLLSAIDGPNLMGDPILAGVGVDNVFATQAPEPASIALIVCAVSAFFFRTPRTRWA